MPPPFIASPDVVRLARAATVGLGLSLLASGPLMARVDLNTASQSQLESIRGIGLSMFKRILDERKRNGPFCESARLCPSGGWCWLKEVEVFSRRWACYCCEALART
jgi:hypothetical protein